MPHVIIWDIETVPDLAGYAAANKLRVQYSVGIWLYFELLGVF